MASYFVKQTDPNDPTKEVYVEVQEDQLEIPASLIDKAVVAHPKYRDVVQESIDRKKQIKKLRSQLDELDGVPVEDEEEQTASPEQAKSKQKPAQAVAPLDEDALYSKFTARLKKQQEEEAAANKARRDQLAAIAEKHGLGAGALPALEVANDPEALAKVLEASNYRFDDQVAGSPSQPDKDAMQARILSDLGLDD